MRIYKAVFCALLFLFCAGLHGGAVTQSICSKGYNVVFYPGGSLKSCVLDDYFSASGVECNRQSQISFYEDGQVESCILSKDTSISGQTCRQLAPVSFYPTGEFRSCVKQE